MRALNLFTQSLYDTPLPHKRTEKLVEGRHKFFQNPIARKRPLCTIRAERSQWNYNKPKRALTFEFLSQKLVDNLRIALPLHRLHTLTDEEPE